ncbi:MAG: nicotinate (nicotinamide) nucleotide adenylyltransferase [Pirellulaceae bacterium]|nr:nicotinate (nicotinamide) nucleotide adenylyltransferase [Pirellulaceae bacterium]
MSESKKGRSIGIWGGTFDPVHVGHLLIAELACERLELDQLRWIPAATAPHAELKNATSANHRLEMLRLATSGNPQFIVDDCELRRGGQSYTVETLTHLGQQFPDTHLILLIGADSLANFSQWRQPERICRLARVVVVARGGQPPPDLRLLSPYLPDHVREEDMPARHLLRLPQFEISSTDIRQRITQGRSIRYMVPASVWAYIDANNLYQVPVS